MHEDEFVGTGGGANSGSVIFAPDGSVCRILNLSHTTVAGVLKSFSALDVPLFHTLEISHSQLDQFALEKLAQTFLSMHTCAISTLRLASCPLSEGVMAVLVRCFKETGCLRRIILDSCRDVSMTSLMSLTSLLAQVEWLELPSCKLPRQAGLILGQALQSCLHLQQLVLRHNNLGDGGARAIADAFHPKKTHFRQQGTDTTWVLDTLDVSDNGISTVGFACLLTISVRHLLVSHNKITSASRLRNLLGTLVEYSRSVHELVAGDFGHLKSLNLSYNPITAAGFHAMAQWLASVHLHSALPSSIGAIGDVYAGHANSSSSNGITSLNIENCCITVDGLGALKDAIRRNPHTKLRELRLGEDNSIGDAKTRRVLTELLECISHVTPQIECIISPTIVPQTPTVQPPPALLARRQAFQIPSDNDDDNLDGTPTLNSPQSSTDTHSVDEPHHPNDDVTDEKDTSPSTKTKYVQDVVRRTMTATLESNMDHLLDRLAKQQSLQNDTRLHDLSVKVETLERFVPRLEGRLDGLSDRIAMCHAQVPAVQADMNNQMALLRHQVRESHAPVESRHDLTHHGNALRLLQGEMDVDGIGMARWKAEMEAAQRQQFHQWKKYMEADRAQLTQRVKELETKVAGLETIVKAEQQASLLALEAISSAFVHNA
ncbi:Aste57867_1111 [Aphanomyces stellatus]|uniref:Aste57867_1111 protein n=1 Tax=Aphanomyces stellatus TaxID=120398 RepID=A0A485K4E2_9STRA|nr:hypothetical protein As57867_001110 [Aphanomyces stellatus]VFT78332.1 Aste57867_1111 [Aphanomyces stellatus]